MRSMKIVPVVAAILLCVACAPREIKPITSEKNASGDTKTGNEKSNTTGGQTSNSQDPDGFPVKLNAETFSKAANIEDVVEFFLSHGNEPNTTRHLIGDVLPMKNEKQNVFGFYQVSLRLMENATYRLLLNIYDQGGQKVSNGTTDGTWKLEKGQIIIEKGTQAGSLPPVKAKGLIGVDNKNEPALYLDFDSDIKTTDESYKVPLKNGWFVFRYTPGLVDPNL